ncbi:MAG: putative secreted protein [Labilithrix sp.]|nr:putative secreted protein [Labilithrix sp.]
MRKATIFGASMVVGLFAIAGCQPAKDDADAGPSSPDGGASSSEGGTTEDGGPAADLPKPVFCPEADPFAPKNPSSVVVSDTVLKADATWTADKVYLIGDDFSIEHHTLTVEAGTTICLYQRGKIQVGRGIDPGEIHLNGTADKPIVITAPPSASDPTRPDVFHGGIVFDTFQGSTLSHVNIWYGGPGGGGASWAFELTNTAHGTDAAKPLLVDHLTIGAVQTRGIRVGTDLGVADGSSIQLTGFVPPRAEDPALLAAAELEIKSTRSVAKAITIAGASIPDAARHVSLTTLAADGKVGSDTDLVSFGLPYRYENKTILQVQGPQNDPVGATLTIHEGVTLAMDGALVVGGTSGSSMGNLVIAGTADKPVILTSTKPSPASGDWEGLYFVGGQFDPARSKIDHAELLYAGVDASDGLQVNHHVGRCGAFDVGALMIDGVLGAYAGPALSNLKIAHSRSDGIVSAASTSGAHLDTSYTRPDITFEDIAGAPLDHNGACE